MVMKIINKNKKYITALQNQTCPKLLHTLTPNMRILSSYNLDTENAIFNILHIMLTLLLYAKFECKSYQVGILTPKMFYIINLIFNILHSQLPQARAE